MATKLQLVGLSPDRPATDVLLPSTGNPAKLQGLNKYTDLHIVADLIGATGGTLDVYLQTSHDGLRWNDYAHFAQLAAGAAAITVTFAVTRRAQQTSITTIGKDNTPALAANSVVGGEFGDQMRVLCVTGVGTSAAATLSIFVNATITQ